MAFVLSSLSGNLISAASAGFAPTNSADVSAIASAYAAEKQDASAMSAYALSSDVSSVIDTVSSNSASWGGGGSTIATGEFLGYTVVSADNGVSVVGNSGVVSSSVSVPYTDTTWATNTISANSNKSQFRIYNFSRTDGNMPSLPTGKSVRIRVTASSNLQNVYSDDQIHLIVYTGTNSGSPIGNWQVQSVQGYRSAIWDKTVTWNSTNQPNMLITAENFNTYVFSTTALYSAVGTGSSASESSYTADILAASPSYVSSVVSSVIDTVSSNSASWGGGGGVDSATVSAIASSYAESAVSSKLDASASSDFYSTSNPSGFLTGIDLSDYATTAYVDSSVSSFVDSAYVESQVSGKEDKLTFGYSGMFISSINGSAIYDTQATGSGVNSATVSAIASAYAESAVSSKLDESATADFYSTSNPSGFLTGVDLSNYATTAYVDSSISSFVDSAYVESQVSGKQDTLTFDWDSTSAISSINGSALAGGGAQVVTSITTGGYGVRAINGMNINASHMVIGAAAANNTSNVVRLGDESYGAGVFLTGNFGTAYYKVNELQLNRNGTGFIGFNIGGAGSQITATSNAGGKFSAGGGGGTRSYYTAFNASASASIEVSGSTAMINIADTGYTSTIYPSSITYWNAKMDSAEMSAYVAKSAYDDLYSSYTALSGVISTYSGWFSELSSISAKVDNSAIGVSE